MVCDYLTNLTLVYNLYSMSIKPPLKRKKETEPVILRASSFRENIMTYLDDGQLADFRKEIEQRSFTVGKTGLSYRTINHWQSMGLLPESVKNNSGEWRKFTLPEMVWLHAAQKMREFGLSLEKIAEAKKGTVEWGKVKNRSVLLEYYISQAWFSSVDPYFVVLVNGSATIASSAELEASKIMDDGRDMLMISLKYILEDIGLGAIPTERLMRVDNTTQGLLDEIDNKKNIEIIIKTNPDKDFVEVATTRHEVDSNTIRGIKSMIKKGKMYAKVSTQYEQGVDQVTQITTKKRIGKSSGLSEKPRP